MKMINEMTHEEIIELDESEVERMVKLMCAQEGVKLLDEPKAPVLEDSIPTPEHKVYEWNDICSMDKSVIEKFVELFSELQDKLIKTTYNYNIGSRYEYFYKMSEYDLKKYLSIETSKVYTKGQYDGLASQMREHNKKKEEYEKDKKEYDENNNGFRRVRSYIYHVWHQHVYLEQNIANYVEKFQEYLELAENNMVMALTFFNKAYTITNQYIMYRLYLEFDISWNDDIPEIEIKEFHWDE